MITKINGEAPFQILASSFTISPSENAYTLQVSADGINYSDLFNVAANQTRMITGVAAGSYYRMKGNTSEVSINWRKDCGDDGSASSIKPMQSLPLTADEGAVAATATGVYQFKNGAWKKIEGGGGTGGTEYTAGANISISPEDVISVTGITSYTGITGQEVKDALGYTPAREGESGGASFTFNVPSTGSVISNEDATAYVQFVNENGANNPTFFKVDFGGGIETIPVSDINVTPGTGEQYWSIQVRYQSTLYIHNFTVAEDGTVSNISVNKLTVNADSANFVKLNSESYVTTGVTSTGAIVSTRHRDSTSDPYVYDAYIRTKTGTTMDAYERLAKASEIPSLEGLATEDWVNGQGFLKEHQKLKTINGQEITGTGNIVIQGGEGATYYAGDNINISPDNIISVTGITSYTGITKSEVTNALGYTPAKDSDIPSLDGYATEDWVNGQGFLKEHQSLEGYATESWVESQGYSKTKVWTGTQAEYDAIPVKDNNTVYLIND